MAGCEADLVVDNDVDRPPRGITAQPGHVEGFHHHTLARKRGITVYHHRQDAAAGVIAVTPLTRAHGTVYDG